MSHFKSIGFLLVSTIVAAPAFAENCADTTFAALSSTSCRGSFLGNINGSAAEITYLNSAFGGSFTFGGSSGDVGNGPFTSNPTVANNGTLTFNSPISGAFVIGLKAATNYSYYLFNAMSPVSSLTFNSTAGIAKNPQGIPQALSHASLYNGPLTPVPEPQTYALMLAGIGAVIFMSKRRRSDLNAA